MSRLTCSFFYDLIRKLQSILSPPHQIKQGDSQEYSHPSSLITPLPFGEGLGVRLLLFFFTNAREPDVR